VGGWKHQEGAEDPHAVWRRASDGKACIATRMAVTKDPCPHGYTWMCPQGADLVKLLVEARQRVIGRTGNVGDQFVKEVEAALPWLRERRRGPTDRRKL
jgi:hypothetical protein